MALKSLIDLSLYFKILFMAILIIYEIFNKNCRLITEKSMKKQCGGKQVSAHVTSEFEINNFLKIDKITLTIKFNPFLSKN